MLSFDLNRLLRLKRVHKRGLQLGVDAGLLTFCFVLAMFMRLENLGFMAQPDVWLALVLSLPISLLAFVRLGFYRAVIRYISAHFLRTIVLGLGISVLALFVISQALNLPIPRSVPAIYWLLAVMALGGVRVVIRALFARRAQCGRAPVVIYGAGASGRQLLSALWQGREYRPVAFVDDARELHGATIGGLPVHSPERIADIAARHGVELVLLAVPSASRAERRAIMVRLETLPLRVRTIPGLSDIVAGRAQVSDIHDVAIEDLLGRDPVPAMPALMAGNIAGKVVMVTGAGGSIGSELCRQILRQGPRVLVLWELSEPALYGLEMELRETVEAEGLSVGIIPLMGSVQNSDRITAALCRFEVETIYHAAAYKHVPLVEHNVVEGLRNNVFGTKVLADAAIKAGVKAFILISTDKAVRPTNIMGASKRLAELVCQAAAQWQSDTVFSMVRFGNVLGSSGSVIPRFRAQLEAGGPITVTHPDITRYFMTIPEAAQLVIQAGAMASGGDVFVLDMGEPIRIVDLAERIVRLSGLEPYRAVDGAVQARGDIAIQFTGLRPGEKLYEELLIGDRAQPTAHPRILAAREARLSPVKLDRFLAALCEACEAENIGWLRDLIKAAPTGYVPEEIIADLMWEQAERQADAQGTWQRPGRMLLAGE
ncbi:nucleoside-diphosphate sugar epimerase [Pelagicola sp. LXJ1103]|nr:nucleoside-diphosphate sugar epimerase [Pelagicola sp. LXJ1103]